MRKLILIIIGLAVLGIAACARDNAATAEFEAAPAAPQLQRELHSLAAGDMYVMQAVGVEVTEEAMDMSPPVDAASANGAAPGQVEHDDIAGTGRRHIIQTARAELETEYFNDVVAELRQLAPSVNGYVEADTLTTQGRRMLTIVLRVPAATFEDVLKHIENMAYQRNMNQWAEDVTDSFYDMRGSLDLRRIEEERTLALIDTAEDIHELLALEQRLSSIRLSIEQYESTLNDMAGRIAYSTITVTLFDIAEEERVIITPTIGERIGGAFGDSVDGTVSVFQSFIVFMAGAVIPLLFIGLIGFVGYRVLRKLMRRRRAA